MRSCEATLIPLRLAGANFQWRKASLAALSRMAWPDVLESCRFSIVPSGLMVAMNTEVPS